MMSYLTGKINALKFIKSCRTCFMFMLICYFFYLHSTETFAQSVQLVWTPSISPNLSHYCIYRTPHIDSSFVLLDTVTYPDTTHMDIDVQWDSNYYYVATVMDLYGNESGFSNMVDISVPVPVELSTFSIQVRNNDAFLEWTTETESNNMGFELQRSIDGEQFVKIGFIEGNNTTVVKNSYRFMDEDLKIGTYYYRLKQIDLNGDYKFTNTIKITISSPSGFRLEQNYPNPFSTKSESAFGRNPVTTIAYTLPKSSHVILSIFNINGQIVLKLVDEFQAAGRYSVKWNGIDEDGNKVASGIYYYKIQALNSAIFRKMKLVK